MRLTRLETDPADRVLNDCVFRMDDAADLTTAPDDYRVPLYLLIATYGKGESEEVAARLITLCQRAGQGWVGLDYNAFRRQVAEELQADAYEGSIRSFIWIEMQRYGVTLEDVLTQVIAVGINDLRDKGYVRVERDTDQEGNDFDVIYPTTKFLEPIQRFVTVAA